MTPDDETTRPTIAIVGGGPKGLAILLKARALARLGCRVPRVVLFERREIAAHWSGRCGFTDGRQPLGTAPEKDLGFPYASSCWGALSSAVNEEMCRTSWQRFLVDTGAFGNWIDAHRPAPSHSQWHEYMRWAAHEVSDEIRFASVRELAIEGRRWVVTYDLDGGKRAGQLEADAAVMTGNGAPVHLDGQPTDHPQIFEARSLWIALRDLELSGPIRAAVVGAGESAATAVCGLIARFPGRISVEMIAPRGALLSRGESFAENRMYTDPAEWDALEWHAREAFVRHTDRGVVSPAAKAIIDHSPDVVVVAATVLRVEPEVNGASLQLLRRGLPESRRYDLVVVAAGYDPFAFTEILTTAARRALFLATNGLDSDRILREMTPDLALAGLAPPLHLPALGWLRYGPGFANLSCLGLLSDRVLAPYVGVPAASEAPPERTASER